MSCIHIPYQHRIILSEHVCVVSLAHELIESPMKGSCCLARSLKMGDFGIAKTMVRPPTEMVLIAPFGVNGISQSLGGWVGMTDILFYEFLPHWRCPKIYSRTNTPHVFQSLILAVSGVRRPRFFFRLGLSLGL